MKTTIENWDLVRSELPELLGSSIDVSDIGILIRRENFTYGILNRLTPVLEKYGLVYIITPTKNYCELLIMENLI